MNRHPNKHIQAAIEYAVSKGWTVQKSPGHAFCRIFCEFGGRGGCIKSIWSTPTDPQRFAQQVIHFVDQCPHGAGGNEE